MNDKEAKPVRTGMVYGTSFIAFVGRSNDSAVARRKILENGSQSAL